MSLARRHRDRVLAAQTVNAAAATADAASEAPAALGIRGRTDSSGASFPPAGAPPVNATPAERAAHQIALRLTHDLRRLKEIKAIDAKVAAKREMLPEYRDWVLGILEADAGVGTGLAAEVVPTVMVWLIDVGAYEDALAILPFLLRHKVAMPSRYQRDAATIAIEEIADDALIATAAGASFPVEVLALVETLTDGLDIHDEVRAKLAKAIGVIGLDISEDLPAEYAAPALEQVLRSLNEAHRLNPRVGVKEKIKRAQKLLAALPAQKTEIAPVEDQSA